MLEKADSNAILPRLGLPYGTLTLALCIQGPDAGPEDSGARSKRGQISTGGGHENPYESGLWG